MPNKNKTAQSSQTNRAAFFDIDNTLLNAKSMFSFQAFYLDNWLPSHGLQRESFTHFSQRLMDHPQKGDRHALNRLFYESYEGIEEDDIRKAANAWFDGLRTTLAEKLWIPSALQLARSLHSRGYQLVAVSGSAPAILAPIIAELNFDHCLATHLEQQGGRFTGRIVAPQMIGEGKGISVRAFAQAHNVALEDSVACGDHITDLSMLECTGQVYIVSGDPELERIARERGWSFLQAATEDLNHDLVHV
jgi:HAD superfamily hydrolase (TIGR01490 family)